MPKFPEDFKYVHYNYTESEIQETIDGYIADLKNEVDGTEISSGGISVKSCGDSFWVVVNPCGCWIPKDRR